MESVGFEASPSDMNTSLSSRIVMYINENYQKELTLTSIATALGYNPSYLSRYFKSCFRIGINQYITLVRLKRFVILSKDREKSIASCAHESGFRSLRTFYRVFYDEFKCSPKDFISWSSYVKTVCVFSERGFRDTIKRIAPMPKRRRSSPCLLFANVSKRTSKYSQKNGYVKTATCYCNLRKNNISLLWIIHKKSLFLVRKKIKK